MRNWGHIYLYAKGQYEQNDCMDDLRKIICSITGNTTVSDNDIFNIVLRTTIKEIEKSDNPSFLYYKMIEDSLEANSWKVGAKSYERDMVRIIKSCLDILTQTKVCIGDLPNPDNTILHIRHQGIEDEFKL